MVRADDGRIVASPKDVCSSFSSFCSSIFSAEPTDAGAQESLLDNIESKKKNRVVFACRQVGVLRSFIVS